jgi:hypothetical protein
VSPSSEEDTKKVNDVKRVDKFLQREDNGHRRRQGRRRLIATVAEGLSLSGESLREKLRRDALRLNQQSGGGRERKGGKWRPQSVA